MNVFLAGTDVVLSIPLVDGDGNTLAVDSVSYRVTDEGDAEILALTALGTFVAEAPTADLTIPAVNNALATGATRALRSVELHCMVGGNTIIVNAAYTIEATETLVIGVNTFQTLAQAEFLAATMSNLPGWDDASPQERRNALIEARRHVVQLNFALLTTGNFVGQDSLYFVPEGKFQTNFVSGGRFLYNGDISMLTADQFVKLPSMFLEVLNYAQIAEANAILGGDPLDEQRRAGITLNTVGESKQMFRTAVPLKLPVCARALAYVSRWVGFSKRISRT